MRRRRNTPKGRRWRAPARRAGRGPRAPQGSGGAGSWRAGSPAAAPLGGGLVPRPIVRCRSPGSLGARGVGEARGGRGDCDSGPGTRVWAVTCRAPPPAGQPHPATACGSWGGWEPSRGARPFPLWRRRLGPHGRAGGMQVVPLAPRHPSSTFSPPPRPPAPLTPRGDETRQAGRGGWVRDAPLAVSAPQLPNCAKFCLLGPAKDA